MIEGEVETEVSHLSAETESALILVSRQLIVPRLNKVLISSCLTRVHDF